MFETAQAILESRGEDMWAWTPTEPTSCPSGRCRTQAIRPACSSGGPAHDLNTAADGILNAVRPNPPVELADPFSAADRLGEGLGHRIARHLGVAAEEQHRPPELLALLAVAALDRGRFRHSPRTTHLAV
jgi:hypothetical protein